jgi:hypothetical protein
LYIKYPQAEELLKSYRKLKSYLKILQIELERLYYEGKNDDINPDDILYSLAIGNRVMTDMPHAMPSPGDKMTNIILAKDRINNEEIRNLIQIILTIGEVVEKTTSALTCLTTQERRIIELKYFEDMPWKDVLKGMETYVEDRQGRRIKREAIEKMLPLLRITPEQLEFCIERMRENA